MLPQVFGAIFIDRCQPHNEDVPGCRIPDKAVQLFLRLPYPARIPQSICARDARTPVASTSKQAASTKRITCTNGPIVKMKPEMKQSSHSDIFDTLILIAAVVVATVMITLSPGIPPETAMLVGP